MYAEHVNCPWKYNVNILLTYRKLIMKERLEEDQCRMYDSVLETLDQLSFSYTLTALVQCTKRRNVVCRMIHQNFFIQAWACHRNMSNLSIGIANIFDNFPYSMPHSRRSLFVCYWYFCKL